MTDLKELVEQKKQKILRAKIERQATQASVDTQPAASKTSVELGTRSVDMGGSPMIHHPLESKTKSDDKGHQPEIACPSPNPFIHPPEPPTKKDQPTEPKQTKVRFAHPRKEVPYLHKSNSNEKIVRETPERDTKVRFNKNVALKANKTKPPQKVQTQDIDKKKNSQAAMESSNKLQQPETNQKPTSSKSVPDNSLASVSPPNIHYGTSEAKSSIQIQAPEKQPQQPRPMEQPQKISLFANQQLEPKIVALPLVPPQNEQPGQFHEPTDNHNQMQQAPKISEPHKTDIATLLPPPINIPAPEIAPRKKDRVLQKIYFKEAEMLKLTVKNLEIAVANMEFFAELKRQGKLPPHFKEYLKELRDVL